MAQTLRFARRKLPHWEVEGGRYFVTVRCADSLPREAVLRIVELHATLSTIAPRSPDFAAQQRRIFHTLEKYLDAGIGSCPLREPAAAVMLRAEFDSLGKRGVAIPHFTIMPNHWHALIVPPADGSQTLSTIMRFLKGGSARTINLHRKVAGPLWQREWFDRWIRDAGEWERCVAYIRNNPAKAGLASAWTQHAWTK